MISHITLKEYLSAKLSWLLRRLAQGEISPLLISKELEHFFTAEQRSIIIKAGESQTLLFLEYKGRMRLVEPYGLRYSFRKDGYGQEYLFAFDQTGGSSPPNYKTFVASHISHLRNTAITFKPRTRNDLTYAGDFREMVLF